MCEESTFRAENCHCKGAKAGACLACLRSSKELWLSRMSQKESNSKEDWKEKGQEEAERKHQVIWGLVNKNLTYELNPSWSNPL